jgi:hypothetical protein
LNLAIIIGVEKYESEEYNNLPACSQDAKVVSDVLNNVKKIEDIVFLNNNESANDVKRQISDFIVKYKNKTVEELFFYFTGHGDRFEEEFCYILSDFNNSKRLSTGLKNSELDNWIKALSPKLTIKIVDACFSGTQYIKSESKEEHEFKKSAEKHGLNDIYFWFSSRDNEASFAGQEFSKFTQSILTGITKLKGDVRYREIMDYVADDFSNTSTSKPIFITQSDNTEKFGFVSDETHQIIFDAFGIESPDESIEKKDKPSSDKENIEISFIEKVKAKSKQVCFSEEKLLSFIEEFNTKIKLWSADFQEIYDIAVESDFKISYIPNSKEVGVWLKKNEKIGYFANAIFEIKTFKVEEYKKLPEKPNSIFSRNLVIGDSFRSMYGYDDTKYKLEKVTKSKKHITGFKYTHQVNNRMVHINFMPKLELAEALSLFIVPIYSNSIMTIHFSYEKRKRSDWNNFSHSTCPNWKVLKVDMSSTSPSDSASEYIKNEVEEWGREILNKKIE